MQNIIEESLIHELTEFFSEVEFFVIAARNKMGIDLTNPPTIGILLNDQKYQTALTDNIQQKFALVFKDKSPKLILKIAENKNYFQMAVKDETTGIKFISKKFTPDDKLEVFVKSTKPDDLVDLILMHRDENNKIVKKKNLKVNLLVRMKGFEFARLQV